MLILGIESSCDETAAAVVENGRNMLSNVINSQIDIHRRYGGVVPEIASRNHVTAIESVVDEALKGAGASLADVDAIAVTYGAGLVGALLVGVSYAKALAYAAKKTLIAVNHIKGHIAANYIAHKNLQPPYLCLVISGGHTAIIDVGDYVTHKLIGTTVDDAVGEAFDKVARILRLPYPGGVQIERLAADGEATIPLPKMFKGEPHYNFSYSGLKTAVINYVHTVEQRGQEVNAADVAASFQKAAIDALVEKTVRAAKTIGHKKIVLAGGVAANVYLRTSFDAAAKSNGLTVYYPPLVLCTDNAAMIASAGYYNYINGVGISDSTLNAVPSIPL